LLTTTDRTTARKKQQFNDVSAKKPDTKWDDFEDFEEDENEPQEQEEDNNHEEPTSKLPPKPTTTSDMNGSPSSSNNASDKIPAVLSASKSKMKLSKPKTVVPANPSIEPKQHPTPAPNAVISPPTVSTLSSTTTNATPNVEANFFSDMEPVYKAPPKIEPPAQKSTRLKAVAVAENTNGSKSLQLDDEIEDGGGGWGDDNFNVDAQQTK